jgi:nitrate/nitrite transporter NarK
VCCLSWFLLPSFASSPVISVFLLSLTCAGAFGATGPFWSMPSGFLSGAAAAGGIAIVTSVGSMSAFLSPIFVGWITDKTGSLAAGQYYYGILFLLAALVLALPQLRKSDSAQVANAAAK